MNLNALLEKCLEHAGCDLYLNRGAAPQVKANGRLIALSDTVLTEADLISLANETMTPAQQAQFAQAKEMNLAYELNPLSRFRVNIYYQKNAICLVIRAIKSVIPSVEHLGLPAILSERILKPRGLILFVGATGVGKSTSQASLLDYRNQHSDGHIVTIEDPIEFLHVHKKSIISQREVGVDTESFGSALKNTLRQAPDVVMIGEIRDSETMHHAMNFAQTGILVLSSLHAKNAVQALERIVNYFPDEQRKQVCMDLSGNLDTIVSQRLVHARNGKMIAAFEVTICTPLLREYILRHAFSEIRVAMEKSGEPGMQTIDKALFDLYTAGKITEEEALEHADSENNLRLSIQLGKGFESSNTPTLEIRGDNQSHHQYSQIDFYGQ